MTDRSLEENQPINVAGVDTDTGEQELIEAARTGDKKAFGQLIRQHQKRLFRFIYGLIGSFDQTEDVVQEAFVKAYMALDRFESCRAFYPWLSTIARNLAYNQLARETKSESLDSITDKGFDPPASDIGPLDQILVSEGQKRFYSALKGLPEPYRVVFTLRHFEDMDYRQIAAHLEIAPGTVDSRLYRARQLLMEALKDLL